MGSDQFQVHPTALNALAGKFEAEAGTLRQQTGHFHQGIFEIGRAFGILGACDGALEKYLNLANSTEQALGKLADVLESDGQRLRTNASVYAEADHAIAGHLNAAGGGA